MLNARRLIVLSTICSCPEVDACTELRAGECVAARSGGGDGADPRTRTGRVGAPRRDLSDLEGLRAIPCILRLVVWRCLIPSSMCVDLSHAVVSRLFPFFRVARLTIEIRWERAVGGHGRWERREVSASGALYSCSIELRAWPACFQVMPKRLIVRRFLAVDEMLFLSLPCDLFQCMSNVWNERRAEQYAKPPPAPRRPFSPPPLPPACPLTRPVRLPRRPLASLSDRLDEARARQDKHMSRRRHTATPPRASRERDPFDRR